MSEQLALFFAFSSALRTMVFVQYVWTIQSASVTCLFVCLPDMAHLFALLKFVWKLISSSRLLRIVFTWKLIRSWLRMLVSYRINFLLKYIVMHVYTYQYKPPYCISVILFLSSRQLLCPVDKTLLYKLISHWRLVITIALDINKNSF